MDTPHLQALLHTGNHYRRNKGQIIKTLDDRHSFSMVASGYIKRYLISKDGSQALQIIYGPGQCFPLTFALLILLNQQIYRGEETYYYEAMTAVELYTIHPEKFQAAAEADPLLYKEVLIVAGQRLQSNIQRAENLALKSALWRTAHQLVHFAQLFGEQTSEGIRIVPPLTQQDLGDSLSLNRETVSRELGKLRSRGLISNGRHFIIPDLEKLKGVYN